MTYSLIGKELRFSRIMGNDGKALILAMDHGFEHGPGDFRVDRLDPITVIEKITDIVDAVMVTPGVLRRAKATLLGKKVGVIIKVSGKTSLRPPDAQLVQSMFYSVKAAIALGADAVAVTVYWGSPYEDLMLERWRMIYDEASSYGLPVLQLAYPRPIGKSKTDPEVVAYAVRAAAESGADMIKTYYTGSRESFEYVVKASLGVPVLMSGGPKRQHSIDFLRDVENVMLAGAHGAVVGRNIFNHRDPKGMAKAIYGIIHESLSAEEAAKRYNIA